MSSKLLVFFQCQFCSYYIILSSLFEDNNVAGGESHRILRQRGGTKGLFRLLDSDEQAGLSTTDEQRNKKRKEIFGSNRVENSSQKGYWHFVFQATEDFCIQILVLASVLMFICAYFSKNKEEVLAQAISVSIAVLGVVFIAGTSNYNKDLQYRALFVREEARYQRGIRNGERLQQIRSDDLMVGDVILVQAGEYIEVDGVLLKNELGAVNSLEVDESQLTGVSETRVKKSYDEESASENDCFIRSGSCVYEGSGKVLVCCVGESSRLGKIRGNILDVEQSSLLGGSTEKLAKTTVTIGLFFSCCMLLVLFSYNIREMHEQGVPLFSNRGIQRLLSSFIEAFMMVVFSVPEGLPLIMTLGLSNTVQQLRVILLDSRETTKSFQRKSRLILIS